MSDTTEEAKELWNETVHAFKSGLHGQEYVPGAPHDEVDSSGDKYEQLEKLTDLRDRGALTQAEFEREKARLLNAE